MGKVTFQAQYPAPPPFVHPPVFGSGLLIDATGEKIAILGRPMAKDVGKSLVSVGYRFGTVTKAGGSALIVSHQDVSVIAGPTYQPDEVMDGSVAIANANAAFVSNTWIDTGNFDIPRAMAGLFAIVIEYDGAGRLGADSVVISGLNGPSATLGNLVSGNVLKTAGWAAVGTISDIVLKFGDGTFGTFFNAFPCVTITTTAYNSGSAADELALEFTVPGPVWVDGAWIASNAAASASFDVVLYNGTTAMATTSTDFHTVEVAANSRFIRVPFDEQALLPGNTYRLALKPTTANNVSVTDLTVSDANHLQAWPIGTGAYLATRVDAGAWTPLTTRRPLMGLYVSAISDGLVIPPTYNLGV